MRNKRVLPALLGSVALTLGLVTVTTSINKEVVNAAEEEATATLSFADKANRTEISNSKQVWEQNGITFTNNKASSTTNVADYQNPVRLYASSSITVEMDADISKIVFDCNNDSYATALKNSISSGASISSDKVTVTFSSPVSSYTVEKLSGQVRLDSISITYSGGATNNVDLEDKIEEYYNEGNYIKNTTINLNDEAMVELKTYDKGFHNNADDLVRKTYFSPDALWMSRSSGKYSYYGTAENGDLTYGTAESPLVKPESVSSAASYANRENNDIWRDKSENGKGMEGYYWTLKDLMDTTDCGWSKTGNVYSTSNEIVIEKFKAITAPCYLGFNENYENYITFTSAEIEEKEGALELRLVAKEETGKFTNKEGIFSQAFIEHEHTYHVYNDEEYTINEEGHTYTCLFCDETKFDEHYGGAPTTEEKAVCEKCGEEYGELLPSGEPQSVATFEFGANGSATHADGSGKTSYSETINGYTLSISGSGMYTNARDAKGNSCIKFGAKSSAGSMKFTVPANVVEVKIYVAKYKSNTTKIKVNDKSYTLTKNSDNGQYDEIVIDTSSTKTVEFTTVSGGYRCMLNTIVFVAVS